jgi:hypothetical protein
MTVARSQLVDVCVTPWNHVISKTVPGAFLLRQGDKDRKQWIENRIEDLSQLFAFVVGGFRCSTIIFYVQLHIRDVELYVMCSKSLFSQEAPTSLKDFRRFWTRAIAQARS